ncbi:hypothetical protein M409DRAFT_48437 [Zasmidium cellare ATCC 36951]|uniref:Uncharacterized protein n=1 Tax=Zasmidium cellare ATCC 36951 TaxID=1080233 RepID=A0A6A6D2X3_ZASCE|nr:uncharacterized protein M409DRAFT_48437 [Zasmidium cellare ATCC 36951]KAF2173463.1 hypothetical protein M409DRAFT_48437 [Zasmidium cellare ATCC 36951]
MALRLNNRIAIITGGASGIGEATALKFADAGARVIVADIQQGTVVERIIASHGKDRALFVHCDVTQESQIQSLVQQAVDFGGRVDVLVNSAGSSFERGYNPLPRVHEMETVDFDRTWTLNARGADGAQREGRADQRLDHKCVIRSGYVLRVSPYAGLARSNVCIGLVAAARMPAYVPSKFAIVGMTKQMAMDYAKERIHVNCVCPGTTKTPLVQRGLDDPVIRAHFEGLHPWGTIGEAQDVADAVLFLCGDEAAWVTGQALAVDGGFTLGWQEQLLYFTGNTSGLSHVGFSFP